jgi:sulfur-carrier protein
LIEHDPRAMIPIMIRVRFPRILADAVGFNSADYDAGDLALLLQAMRRDPRLGQLLFDEQGALRRHLLLFVNGTATKHLPTTDFPITPADHIELIQAVSGG